MVYDIRVRRSVHSVVAPGEADIPQNEEKCKKLAFYPLKHVLSLQKGISG